jgi:hypothetical protein
MCDDHTKLIDGASLCNVLKRHPNVNNFCIEKAEATQPELKF